MSEIILNLNLPEYQDDFLAETTDSNQLWQQQANRKLVDLLQKMGNDAHRYKEQCQHDKKIPHQKLSSYHHAIFISGARGAGKTVFLKNAKEIWKHETAKQDKKPNLHFMPVIDPTLLNINERFSEVIIASVYAAVEEKLNNQAISKTPKDDFYNSLKDLSGALVKPSELAELRGIDRIQKYRSGIHLERYFHQFLIASVRLLECDALVLPIDDVDMKISNAFEVLDDIRCLLSCPLVLPLVSGDDKLYRHMVTLQFEGELVKNKEASNAGEGRQDAGLLSDAYLTKVFPHHARLLLQPIVQLLPQLKIQDKKHKGTIAYSEYDDDIRSVFYPLCNGLERSADWPRPVNAREVTQLVRLLSPHVLKSSEYNQEALWRTFSMWAEAKQDGAALTNAESYLYIRAAQQPKEFSLSRLIAFNPLLQKEHYYWAKKSFYQQQVERIDELKGGKDFNKKILDTVFTTDIGVMRSMPALEYIKDPLFLSSKAVKNTTEMRILIAIYTHHDYYSQQKGLRYHVFFSRAFEILVWSMLAVTSNLSSACDIKMVCGHVFERAPFYSIFAMNATKSINEDDTGDDIDNNIDDNEDEANKKEILQLLEKIDSWVKENKNILTDLADRSLLPLIAAVFNKVFTQLHLLRCNFDVKKDSFSDERLSDMAKRFSYIFINALASFVQDGVVVNANVAVSASSATVRDHATFLSRDRTLVRNLAGLRPVDNWNIVNEDGSFNQSDFFRLINVMNKHPVITLYSDQLYGVRLRHSNGVNGNIWSKVSSESKFSSMSARDLNGYYLKQNERNIVKTREVKEWAISQLDIAELIFSRLNELRDTDSKTRRWIEGTGYTARLYNGLRQALDSKTED